MNGSEAGQMGYTNQAEQVGRGEPPCRDWMSQFDVSGIVARAVASAERTALDLSQEHPGMDYHSALAGAMTAAVKIAADEVVRQVAAEAMRR